MSLNVTFALAGLQDSTTMYQLLMSTNQISVNYFTNDFETDRSQSDSKLFLK